MSMECVQNGDSSHISGRCHLSFTNTFANPGPNFHRSEDFGE